MKKYIFTFGLGQRNKDYIQIIYAKDREAARKLMFEVYGNKWSWQYDEKQWEVTLKNCPLMRDLIPLENVIMQEPVEEPF